MVSESTSLQLEPRERSTLLQQNVKDRGKISLAAGMLSILFPVAATVIFITPLFKFDGEFQLIELFSLVLLFSCPLPAIIGVVLGIISIRRFDVTWLAGLVPVHHKTEEPASRRKAVAGIAISLVVLTMVAFLILFYVAIMILYAFQGGHRDCC